MGTPITNFAKVTVSTGYDASATSLVLSSGHGSRLASEFPYPLTWWDATTYSDPADDPQRELVLVTNRTGDTLTVTRGAEGTAASTKNTGGKTYKMLGGVTAGMWDAVNELALSETFRGLLLQTHPDSDVAASKIRLIHADAIVMDDGEEVTGWDDLDLDLTVSGIGGIDTGSEQVSTWYQVIAGRNPVSGAKGLYAHRMKDYFLDEDVSAGEDASQGLRSNVDNSTVKVSQGFKVDTAGPVEFVDVKLLKTGSPTGNYWLTIETSSGGVPSGTVLATSDKYSAARLITTGWVRIPFRTPASLSAATQYHLVLQGDYAVSGSNFISWRMDGSAASYANGSKALFDSDTATWTTDTDDDLTCKIYVTRNDTALTKPAGYTQAAVIGYAYNNASGNLKHFWQVERQTFCGYDPDWLIGSFSSTQKLVELSTFVPPVPISLFVLYYNGTASGAALGVLSSTDTVSTQATEVIGSVKSNTQATAVSTFPPIMLSPYQGVVFDTAAGTTNLYVSSFTW